MSMYVLTSTVQMYVLKNRRSSHTDMKRRHPHAADESVCVQSVNNNNGLRLSYLCGFRINCEQMMMFLSAAAGGTDSLDSNFILHRER